MTVTAVTVFSVCGASVVYLVALYGSSNHMEKVLSNFVINPTECEALIEGHGAWHWHRVTFLLLFRHPGPTPGWETQLQTRTEAFMSLYKVALCLFKSLLQKSQQVADFAKVKLEMKAFGLLGNLHCYS